MMFTTLTFVFVILRLTTAYQGRMTYYNPGGAHGSCGAPSKDSDLVVALSPGMMTRPICYSHINIWNPATQRAVDATIVDTCPGCGYYDIDASPALWDALGGDYAAGHSLVDWGGSAAGGKRDVNLMSIRGSSLKSSE